MGTLPQHLVYNVGGTVELYRASRAVNATCKVVTGAGATLASGITATVATLNTTISEAAGRSQYKINVTSNTGIASGGRAWLTDDPEEVLFESVSGATVTLRRPLMKPHANAATLQATRVTCTINSSVAGTRFYDGHILWNIDGGTAVDYSAVECTDYPVTRLATETDLFDAAAQLQHVAPRETDWQRMLDKGLEEALKALAKVSPDQRCRVYPASPSLVLATCYAALMLYYQGVTTDDGARGFAAFSAALQREVESIAAVVPRDANLDGVVSETERISPRTVRLVRG